jgi:phosphoenolpyruvate carboxylase
MAVAQPVSSEKLQDPDASAADAQRLEGLFADVLLEQEGPEFRDAMDALYAAAAAARQGEPGADDELARLVAETEKPMTLVRACTVQLALANLTDELRLVREHRASDKAGGDPPPASIPEAAARLKHDPEAAETLDVRLVLTAHPTDMARRSVLGHQRQVSQAMEKLADPRLGAQEREELEHHIREALAVWWDTSEVRAMRPRVADEVRRKLFFFDRVLFDAAGELAFRWERVVGKASAVDRPPVRFGNWAGADMDGNPNVSPRTILETLQAMRVDVLRQLRDRIRPLRTAFSQRAEALPISDELRESLARDEREMPETAGYLVARYPHEAQEPLRRKFSFILARVENTLEIARGGHPSEPGYHSPEELLEDLEQIRSSLGSKIVAGGQLARLIWQVRIFGFHLATCESRDNAPELQEACRALLPGYAAADSEERRTQVLTDACLAGEVPPRPGGDLPRAAATFDTIATALRTYGVRGLDTFIVSNAEGASDVLAALWLARASGLFSPGGDDDEPRSELELVPLFERRSALQQSTQTMASLYDNAAYRVHLEARGRGQEVMLGYSDAGKDEGYAPAQWTMYRAQEDLAEQAREHDVNLRMFHGRGGSPPRGGGPAFRTILGQPPGTVRGRIKITEQGEVITAKFSHPQLAVRSLEQTVAAVVRATVDPGRPAPDEWRDEVERMADVARTTYSALVKEDEGFIKVLTDCTPLTLVDELNIASRPSSRKVQGEFSDLRAIPWVFAWMQTRIGLPSWYGAGTALAEGDLALQRDMWAEWPFFHNLITTLEAALTMADPNIGERYMRLATDKDAAERVWDAISSEHDCCVSRLLDITGHERLGNPTKDALQRYERRVPWLDALSYFQLHLLERDREGDEAARNPLLATIAGLATGLRTTG